MDARRNIYVVSTDNEYPSLAYPDVQLLRDKQKGSRSSYIMLTLALRHTYSLTSLEKYHAFFDQCRPLLEPTIFHDEVFSAITPEKTSNFGQTLKGPDWVNWIKVSLAQYDNNSTFGILSAPFPYSNLTITTRVLWSVLAPYIKNISDNIYLYFPRHCANVGPQLKVVYFEQSSCTVLAAPTLRLIISISATYHLTIGILDVTNTFQNTLKASSER